MRKGNKKEFLWQVFCGLLVFITSYKSYARLLLTFVWAKFTVENTLAWSDMSISTKMLTLIYKSPLAKIGAAALIILAVSFLIINQNSDEPEQYKIMALGFLI